MKQKYFSIIVVVCLFSLVSISCSLLGGKTQATEIPATETETPVPSPTVKPTNTPTPEPEKTATPTLDPAIEEALSYPVIGMWAVYGDASSAYSGDEYNWSVYDALGAPNTEGCADLGSAWASEESTGEEWLEVYFEQPVVARQVNIHQNFMPDQVVKVELIDTDYVYTTVYESTPVKLETCPYILQVDVDQAYILTVGVRITIDQSVFEDMTWNEIDAVELVGHPLYPQESTSLLAGSSSFEYITFGCKEIIVSGNVVEDNSPDSLYSFILLDDKTENALLIYLPRNLSDGLYEELTPYTTGVLTPPSAMLYLEPATFYAQSGLVYVYFNPDGTISGNMEFNAVNKDDPSCEISVNLSFAELKLPD